MNKAPQSWRGHAEGGIGGMIIMLVVAFGSWVTGVATFTGIALFAYYRSKKSQR